MRTAKLIITLYTPVTIKTMAVVLNTLRRRVWVESIKPCLLPARKVSNISMDSIKVKRVILLIISGSHMIFFSFLIIPIVSAWNEKVSTGIFNIERYPFLFFNQYMTPIKTFKDALIEIIKNNSFPLLPIKTDMKPLFKKLDHIRCVVFDVYGTLFVSGSGDIGTTREDYKGCLFHKAAEKSSIVMDLDTPCEFFNNIFYSLIRKSHSDSRKKGIVHPEVDILSIWSDFFSRLKKENIVMTFPAESEIIKFAVYYEILSNPVWPMPGISETLLALEQRGFITGIVSNAQFYTPLLFKALTGKSLTALGFKKDLLFYSYEYAQAKPSPIMFEKLKDRLYNTYEITADETIYIGNDMLNDVKTASSAGLKTALFAGDRRSLRLREESCTGIVPDAVITSLNQLYKRML